MDLKLESLRSKMRNVARDSRNLSRALDSIDFAQAWASASDSQRAEAEAMIAAIDKMAVEKWTKRILAAAKIEDKPTKELRALARAAGVPYYNNKNKDELLKELNHEHG